MISFLRTWSNQIIVALIIATIFEMILPSGNNKKYIKMIIGLYVLFTVIQPIVTKITGNNLEIADFNYKKYFKEDVLETSSQDFEDNNSKLIEQAYIDNIKNDMKVKIKQRGYEVLSINIHIIQNENLDNYGTLESIQINVKKIEKEENDNSSNVIKIEDVDISIQNTVNNNTKEKSNLSEKEKNELIQYLSSEYSIDKKKIIVN